MDQVRPKLTPLTLTSICRKTIKYFIFKKVPIPEETSSKYFWSSDTTSKMRFWHTFWCIYVRSSAAVLLCRPQFCFVYCSYQPEGGRSPAGLWAAVRCSTSQDSYLFLVLGRGGSRFWIGPTLSFFPSGLLVPHWSGQVPKTSSLYSAVTHYTCQHTIMPCLVGHSIAPLAV